MFVSWLPWFDICFMMIQNIAERHVWQRGHNWWEGSADLWSQTNKSGIEFSTSDPAILTLSFSWKDAICQPNSPLFVYDQVKFYPLNPTASSTQQGAEFNLPWWFSQPLHLGKQELEKFKYVLDFKVKDLLNKIEPSQLEARHCKERMHRMEKELMRFHLFMLSLKCLLVATILSTFSQETKMEVFYSKHWSRTTEAHIENWLHWIWKFISWQMWIICQTGIMNMLRARRWQWQGWRQSWIQQFMTNDGSLVPMSSKKASWSGSNLTTMNLHSIWRYFCFLWSSYK